MIVVVDTSILLAALLRPNGFVHRLLHRAATERYVLCVSRAILQELTEKAQTLVLSGDEVIAFLAAIDQITLVGDRATYSPTAVQQDDHVLGCYRNAKADLVLTSDKPLIRKLKRLDIPAVRPSEFATYFGTVTE